MVLHFDRSDRQLDVYIGRNSLNEKRKVFPHITKPALVFSSRRSRSPLDQADFWTVGSRHMVLHFDRSDRQSKGNKSEARRRMTRVYLYGEATYGTVEASTVGKVRYRSVTESCHVKVHGLVMLTV
ncbi:hypothetical protein LR48_Vigan08g074300 [Vigna angularis]|uniref:Uncharacterized protein n=1 Tax=Phaseolus angularis TaxID=3914 RepID=A0A0L9V4I5_PHAAN|nr:hypothetical protein LR48_Vigan08g074300 [Vigna angularis]